MMKKHVVLLVLLSVAVAAVSLVFLSGDISAYIGTSPMDPEEPYSDDALIPATEPEAEPLPEATLPPPYESVEEYRAYLMEMYGEIDIGELLEMTLATLDPTRYEMSMALLLRKDETLPLLRERLRTGGDDERYELLMLIQGQLRWEELAPEIVPLLYDSGASERVRGRAATALALFRKEGAVPAIRSLLETAEDTQARQFAAMALGHLGDTESTDLIERVLLQDESPFARLTAAAVLGALGSAAGLNEAVELSSHERFDLRIRAAEALSYIGTTGAVERLTRMSQDDSSSMVRSESAEFLVRAELEKHDRQEALALLQMFLAPDSDLPGEPSRWAFIYLAEYFAYDAEEFLQHLARTPGPLRHPAMVALLKLDAGVYMIPYEQRETSGLQPPEVIRPVDDLVDDITVYIDGRLLPTDVPPVIRDGRTLVPLRAIFEALETDVEWIPETGTVIGSKGENRIELTVDSTRSLVNGREVALDVPATIIEGRTLVPVRFIAESTGQDVSWDADTRRVIITTR